MGICERRIIWEFALPCSDSQDASHDYRCECVTEDETIWDNVPSELSYLPLLRDVVVLPRLMYYLRNWVRRRAAVAVCLYVCERNGVSQTILKDKSNEGRGEVR